MTVGNRTRKKEWSFTALFWIGNIVLWSMLYWRFCVVGTSADFVWHDKFVRLLIEGKMVLMHPGYHALVSLFALLFGMKTTVAAVIVLTIAMCVSIYVTMLIMKDSLEIDFLSNVQLLLVSFLLNIVQPIFFYGFAPGYSSGNSYSSPTQAVCKPFTLLVIWLFIKMNKHEHPVMKEQFALLVMMILSCLMKPLFAMAFIPAAGCWYLLRIKDNYSKISKDSILQYFKYIWPMIGCGIFLILQYIYGIVFNGANEEVMSIGSNVHVCIGFLRAWGMVVDNVAVSILFAYLFPIVMIIIILYNRKKFCGEITTQNLLHYIKKSKHYIELCVLYAGISLIYIAFLYQDNGCEAHMNFRNAWVVTFNYVYFIAMAILLYLNKEKGHKSTDVRIGFMAFSVHLLFGIALIAKNLLI